MLCTECMHNTVCRFIDRAKEVTEIEERVRDTPDPITLSIGCNAFREGNVNPCVKTLDQQQTTSPW